MLATFEPLSNTDLVRILAGRSTVRPGQQPTDAAKRPESLADLFTKALDGEPPLPELDDLPLIPPSVRELVLDRIDAAFREGLLQMDCDRYAELLMVLMPDEFEIPAPTKACLNPPRSAERVATYAERCRQNVRLFHADDLAADTDLRKGVRVTKKGGVDPKVVGWDD